MNLAEKILVENQDFQDAEHLVDVEGLSSPRVCHFLNHLVAGLDEGEHYLEIGTWKGLTLCSAIKGNEGKTCYACDKFRVYGQWTGWGFKAKRALYENLERYSIGGADVHFHHMNSRRLFAKELVPPNVKVYFYDGDHSYRGTKHHVVAAAPLLCERSFLLMDDFNDPVIEKATYDGIKEAGLEILWERNLRRDDGWWNGLGVFFLGKAATN